MLPHLPELNPSPPITTFFGCRMFFTERTTYVPRIQDSFDSRLESRFRFSRFFRFFSFFSFWTIHISNLKFPTPLSACANSWWRKQLFEYFTGLIYSRQEFLVRFDDFLFFHLIPSSIFTWLSRVNVTGMLRLDSFDLFLQKMMYENTFFFCGTRIVVTTCSS